MTRIRQSFPAGLIIALAAIIIGVPAWAEDEGKRPDRPERRHKHRAHMQKMDTDGDGKISLDEFLAGHEARLRERFDKMDRNGDGFLSKDDRPPRDGADDEL